MTQQVRLAANPLIEASQFDSDASKPMVLCVVPTTSDPVRLVFPERYMDLVRQFDGERTDQEAVDSFLDQHPGTYERDWLLRLVQRSLFPKGVLIPAGVDLAHSYTIDRPKRSFLSIQMPVFPPGVVQAVAAKLNFMFEAPALALGAIIFLASHLYVYGVLMRNQHINFNEMTIWSILTIMLLSTMATICHEFGHASAAARYGCKKMTIGWGIYIVYSVLWTNVSEAWRLPRRQRAMVDIGGVYFESVFLIIVLCLYLKTGDLVFLFAFVFIDLSIVTTFNPFLRMDGYWLLSDLFGIVNLRQQQLQLLEELASRLFGGRPSAIQSSLSRRAKWTLCIYSAGGIVFLAYLLKVIIEFVIVNVAREFPDMLHSLLHDVAIGTSTTKLAGSVVEILWRTLMLVGAAVMLLSWTRRAGQMLDKVVRVRFASQRQSA